MRHLDYFVLEDLIRGVLIFQNKFSHHKRGRMRIKHQFRIRDASPDRQPKIQSSSVEETLQRIMGQTNNDCRFPIFISTSSLHQPNVSLLEDEIQEVEMVDSVDDLMSSSSTRGISMPNFEILDARIASALNRIIHNSQFKRRISLEEQKGPEAGPFFAEDRLLT